MNYIAKNFLRGLVIVIPIAVTIYVIYQIFIRIDRLLGLPFPGAGFVITIVAIFLVGVLASNIVGRKLLGLMEALFIRAPFVKIVYQSIKDLIEAFVGDRKRFNQPVAVTFSQLAGSRALGFVTREDLAFLGMEGSVAVYFPQSYNFAGNLLVVPASAVERLETDSSKLMTFIVSGGVSGA